jgi:hypothetical protein
MRLSVTERYASRLSVDDRFVAGPLRIEGNAVLQDIVKIEYQTGIVEQRSAIGTLPLVRLTSSKIPPEVYRELRETDILNCGGVYGQMDTKTPFQYDQLRIYLTEDTVEVTVFNRVEALKTAPDHKLLRIDRFMGVLKQFIKPKRKDVR